YETKGQLDKALEQYDAVVQAGGNSGFANESYVRGVELRAQHPELTKTVPRVALSPGQQLPPAK
ncbi:MAG TPA: hypothetical protein VH255_01225, partial [Verrucomicrobiae bacterium]|nr:hypothetical protein [Verrucomicrobiae bacterium]